MLGDNGHDHAVHRRDDARVAQVDSRRVHLRARLLYLCAQRTDLSARGIQRGPGCLKFGTRGGVQSHQRLLSAIGRLGLRQAGSPRCQLRLQRGDRRLGRAQRGLLGLGIHFRDQLTGLDLLT